jgi:hypothetical protein
MIVVMAKVRITEAEFARDIRAVLAKVREGDEVIVEEDHRAVAVIKAPQGPGRKISECIVLAKAYEEKLGHAPVPDPEFAKDVQAAIDAHREPLKPPSWDECWTPECLLTLSAKPGQ